MPKSAEEALQGMLAEGIEASAVVDALAAQGFKIEPPEGDASYEGAGEADEGAGLMVALGIGEPEGDAMPEKKEDKKDVKSAPDTRMGRYEKAAGAAMKKDDEKYKGKSRY